MIGCHVSPENLELHSWRKIVRKVQHALITAGHRDDLKKTALTTMVKGSLKVTVNIISQQKNPLDLLAIDIRKWNITGMY